MNGELREAVGDLYDVFGAYRLRDTMDHCGHCVGPDEVQTLLVTPMGSLHAGQLERFATKAMSTWGDEQDFKHFLPRILELLVQRAFVDSGYLLGRVLGTCAHHETAWPSQENAAILRLRTALWQDLLATFPSTYSARETLEAFAQADQPITPYLDMWKQSEQTSAVWHLCDFIDEFLLSSRSDQLFCHELDAALIGRGVCV